MDAKLLAALDREKPEPCRWWYLSFADQKFRGAALVLAPGIIHAVLRCHQLGINPGGEVLGMIVPEDELPPCEARERLLTKAELKHFFGRIQRINSAGEPQGVEE
jgi:hypothetical protein